MWKRYIFVIILAVLIAVISLKVVSEEAPVGEMKISTQRFLHLGKTIEDQKGNFSDRQRAPYLKSLNKFPSLKSCLVGDTSQTMELGDLKLDLDRINTLQDVEVCIFWVSDYLRDPHTIGKWLSNLGFSIKIKSFDSNHYLSGTSIVIGQWDKNHHSTRHPFHLKGIAWIETFFVKSGIRLDIKIGQNKEVIQVDISYSRGP